MNSIEVLKQKPVYLYTEASVAPSGQGSAIRIYTNLRAYLDIGFQVEVIRFYLDSKNEPQPYPEIPNVRWTSIEYTPLQPTWAERGALYLGASKNAALNVLFPIKPFVTEQVRQREKNTPKAIHHFEYDNVASAAVALKNLNAVWSHHDILSVRIPLLREMRKDFSSAEANRSARVRAKELRNSEDWIADRVKLILNIAAHEQEDFRWQRGYQNAEWFPMSWHDETPAPRRRTWMADNRLRLLHLGSVDGFVGYDSLRFILEKVFPLLPIETLTKIELLVAGTIKNNEFSQHIRVLAKPYPQVKFLGFVDNLKALYGEVDLQVVGGIRATGMRTRIIESFVFGLPVLSTTESARGLVHLQPGDNILLADHASAFANALSAIKPQLLERLAASALKTYESNYSRSVAAGILQRLLETHL